MHRREGVFGGGEREGQGAGMTINPTARCPHCKVKTVHVRGKETDVDIQYTCTNCQLPWYEDKELSDIPETPALKEVTGLLSWLTGGNGNGQG